MKPLKGVTILDISRLLPGGFASLLLYDQGARVIKIEQPGVGDYYRAVFDGGGILGKGHVRAIFQGKESVGLDLKDSEGRAIFEKLVDKADVVLENFRPGVLKKLKLDYSRLKKIKPSIILCSITGFGQRGPSSHLAGHDLNYLGLSGLLSRLRDPSGKFVLPDFQIIDLVAGLEAAMKISAALYQKTRTKKGCWIDGSMVGSGRSLARLYDEESNESPVAGGLVRYGVYECADQKNVTLAALEPKFWVRFCRRIGREVWTDQGKGLDPDPPGRRKELERIFKSKTAREWITMGAREDVCIFPVEESRDLSLLPTSETPRLGLHTGRVLKSVGYGNKEIAALRARRVIE